MKTQVLNWNVYNYILSVMLIWLLAIQLVSQPINPPILSSEDEKIEEEIEEEFEDIIYIPIEDDES